MAITIAFGSTERLFAETVENAVKDSVPKDWEIVRAACGPPTIVMDGNHDAIREESLLVTKEIMSKVPSAQISIGLGHGFVKLFQGGNSLSPMHYILLVSISGQMGTLGFCTTPSGGFPIPVSVTRELNVENAPSLEDLAERETGKRDPYLWLSGERVTIEEMLFPIVKSALLPVLRTNPYHHA